MKKRIFIALFLAFFAEKISAQIGINTTNTPPNPAAMLDIASSTKGLLIPRMTTIQKDAIPNKVEGLTVYDTNLKLFSYWTNPGTGFQWQNFGTNSGGGASVGWQTTNDNLSNTNIGNVGIGTQYPGFKLHVNGNGSFFSDTKIGYEQVLPGINYFNSSALQISTPTSQNYPLGIENNMLSLDGQSIQAYFRNIDDPSFSDYSNTLKLNPIAGNVGIGNSAANYSRLQINGSVGASVAMFGADKAGVSINADNPEVGFNYFYNGTTKTIKAGYGSLLGMYPSSGDMYFANFNGNQSTANFGNITGFQTVMTIKQNGNIGIGTTNPTHKLSINGSIRAKEIRVNTGWADYVFEPTYQLRPLKQVEQFIKDNGHLPDIPSAKTIQDEGLDVGALQTKMMAKIEELTLYLIEANKQIELLKNQTLIKK
jgi:hypothetical protein